MARPVTHAILIPGFLGGTSFFLPFRDHLRSQGLMADAWERTPFVYGRPLAWYAERLARDIIANPAKQVVLIGWSMGGLIAVEVMRNPQVAAKVRRVIAFASPFDGTWAARVGGMFDPLTRFNVRQMAPGSPELAALADFLREPRAWDFHAINGKRDWLAPGPLQSIDPSCHSTGHYDHRSLLYDPTLFDLIHKLILLP